MHHHRRSWSLTAAPAVVLALTISLSTPSLGDGQPGDATLGKKVFFSRCIACHEPPSRVGLTAEEIAMNEAALPADALESTPTRGPSLSGLLGRKAGSLAGYSYSDAMKASNVIWSEDTLRPFLQRPATYIPRNKMPFNGLKREGELETLIAYLNEVAM
jgi:cytochrome c